MCLLNYSLCHCVSLQILQHIQRSNFTTKEGDQVFFNQNGDPAAKYEIINWQPGENGSVNFVTLGLYDATLPTNKQMNLQKKSIIWTQNSLEVKSYKS